jgi:hypothetical protein
MDAAPQEKLGASKCKSYLAKIILILVTVLFVLVIIIMASPFAGPYFAIYQADEGFKRAKKTIDPEPLRAWALGKIQSHGGTNGSLKISNSEIPSAIRNLYSYPPEGAFVNDNAVIVIWGGGFFGWNIQIGDTNFSLPFKSDNSECPYNFEWVKGIYYTRESDWKLQ